MKQRFHTLKAAANVLNTTVYALLQAAEAGELTLALPTHGKYLFRFCPRERGKYYPDMQFMSCDCIPVPPHTISVLLANQLTTEPEPATFCQVEFPSNAGSWIEFWHIDDFLNLDIPTSTPGLIIRLSESSLRITDAELERVAAGREQDDLFDLVGPDPRRLDLSGIRQGIERQTYIVASEQAADSTVAPQPTAADCEQGDEPAASTPPTAGDTEQGDARATDDNAELANLFDPVKVATLEALFPDGGKWAKHAERAARNGLQVARCERGKFNPYLAAVWWINEQGPTGWKLERCLRVLAKNLPDRSIDSKHLLTGEFD